jgi:hypothetical protein
MRLFWFWVFSEVPIEDIIGLLVCIKITAYQIANHQRAIFIAKWRVVWINSNPIIQMISFLISWCSLHNLLSYIGHQMLDIILEQHVVGRRFWWQGRNIVPNMIYIVNIIIIAKWCWIIDNESYVMLLAFRIFSYWKIVSQNDIILFITWYLYEMRDFFT